VLESLLLTRDRFQAIAEREDGPEDLLHALADTPYADLLPGPDELDRSDGILEEHWADTLRNFREISPSPEVLDLFVLEADFQNYKSFLKARFFELPAFRLPAGRIQETEFERVLDGFLTPAADLLGPPTALLKSELDRGTASATRLDWIFDAALLSAFIDAADRSETRTIARAVRCMTALRTAEVILRALRANADIEAAERLFVTGLPPQLAELAQSLIDASPEDRLGLLQPLLAEGCPDLAAGPQCPDPQSLSAATAAAVIASCRRDRLEPFGPERVFTYLLRLRNEIENLKLVVGGRMCHVQPDELKRHITVP
jgi:vacuolar-type H+-ATPase subunit C/Vma6